MPSVSLDTRAVSRAVLPLDDGRLKLDQPAQAYLVDARLCERAQLQFVEARVLGSSSSFADRDAHMHLVERQTRLYADTHAYFSRPLPLRLGTIAMDLSGKSTKEAAIALLQSRAGIIVGERDGSTSAKRLLLDLMAHGRELHVTTLYVEHLLGDIHQRVLSHANASHCMTDSLQQILRDCDRRAGTDGDDPFSFSTVVAKAIRAGIDVVALDCAASYWTDNRYFDQCYRRYDRAGEFGRWDSAASDRADGRSQLFKYHALRTVVDQPPATGGKWLMLCGLDHVRSRVNQHGETLIDSVGLAELLDVAALRAVDATSQAGPFFAPDSGVFQDTDWCRTSRSDRLLVRADYVVKLPPSSATRFHARDGKLAVDDYYLYCPKQGLVLRLRTSSDAVVEAPLQRHWWGAYSVSVAAQDRQVCRRAWSVERLTRKLARDAFHQVFFNRQGQVVQIDQGHTELRRMDAPRA